MQLDTSMFQANKKRPYKINFYWRAISELGPFAIRVNLCNVFVMTFFIPKAKTPKSDVKIVYTITGADPELLLGGGANP